MAKNKLSLENSSLDWSDKRRYKVNAVVSYLGDTWQNLTGKNSEPGVGVDWFKVPNSAGGGGGGVDPSRTLNINGVVQDLSANRIWRTAQADTGVSTSAGISVASGTQVNIGAVTGYVVNNESNPDLPTYTFVNYAGETNKTVTTLGSGIATYVMLNSAGVIVFQNTFPTSAQRKSMIYISKIGHPAGVITTAGDEPDFITSPLAQFRDLFQAFNYVNQGVYASPAGANLTFNTSAGFIVGNGINFKTDKTNPNTLNVPPSTPASFFRRTQTGAGGASTTFIDPANYEVAGVITAVGGGANSSTLQYIWCVPGLGFIVTYGQTVYSTLNNAIAQVGKENPVIYSSLIRNSILIGVLAVNKSATELNNINQAQFFKADIFGQIIGAVGGSSTGTLQTAYNNSLVPQITTTVGLGALTIKRGSAADTDNILVGQNGAGTVTSSITGAGVLTAASLNSNGSFSAIAGIARGAFFNPTLTPTANNDVLAALDINPTFNVGAFTNVLPVAIKANGAILVSSLTSGVGLVNNSHRSSFILPAALYSHSKDASSANIILAASRPNLSATNAFSIMVDTDNQVKFDAFNSPYIFRTTNVETVRFNTTANGGRVLMQNGGTFTDNGVDQLQVGGTVLSTGFKVTGATGALLSNGTVGTNQVATVYVESNGNNSTAIVGNADKPFLTLDAALDALPASGGRIKIGIGSFFSPTISKMKSNVAFFGSGKPTTNSVRTISSGLVVQSAPTKLVGGTILLGVVGVSQKNGVEFHDLGVDSGLDFCNTYRSGVAEDALSFFQKNGTGLPSQDGLHELQANSPPTTGAVVSNVITLCKDANSAVHAMLIENTFHAKISNVSTYFGIHGLVIKSVEATVDGFDCQGHGANALIIKANDYAYSYNNQISNGVISSIGAYDTGGILFVAENGTSPTTNNLNNISVIGTKFGVLNSGFTQGNNLSNLWIFNTQGVGVDIDQDFVNSTFSNIDQRQGTTGFLVAQPSTGTSILLSNCRANQNSAYGFNLSAPGVSVIKVINSYSSGNASGTLLSGGVYGEIKEEGTVSGTFKYFNSLGTDFLATIDTNGRVNKSTSKTSEFYPKTGGLVTGSPLTDIINFTDAANNTGHLGIRSGGAAFGADGAIFFETNGTQKASISTTGVFKVDNLAGPGDAIVGVHSDGTQYRTSSTAGYKVYTALVYQTGTGAPTATVMENTLGGTVVWVRNSTGSYSATLSGVFTVGKTTAAATGSSFTGYPVFRIPTSSVNEVQLITTTFAGAATDGVLDGSFVEIRVYN